MKNNKTEDDKKQCDINVVSSSDAEYRIVQTSKNVFYIEKFYKDTEIKGFFWWKKEETFVEWKRITKHGKRYVEIFHPIRYSNVFDLIEYKTKKEAEEWIKNHKKYPIHHYC